MPRLTVWLDTLHAFVRRPKTQANVRRRTQNTARIRTGSQAGWPTPARADYIPAKRQWNGALGKMRLTGGRCAGGKRGQMLGRRDAYRKQRPAGFRSHPMVRQLRRRDRNGLAGQGQIDADRTGLAFAGTWRKRRRLRNRRRKRYLLGQSLLGRMRIRAATGRPDGSCTRRRPCGQALGRHSTESTAVFSSARCLAETSTRVANTQVSSPGSVNLRRDRRSVTMRQEGRVGNQQQCRAANRDSGPLQHGGFPEHRPHREWKPQCRTYASRVNALPPAGKDQT
jgi:hypothetical protein